jgi:hypothetical protein
MLNYHTKTAWARVVQNERTGTAQPPGRDVAMYGDCELTTGGSASNSRIVTAHLPQETQQRKRAQRVSDVREHISLNNT